MGRMTLGTLFSGFGGVDIGAMAAGVTPIWAVEHDADIAAVYRQNIGDHVRVGDVLDMNPADFEMPDILHASPPCPNFSQAKTGAVETDNDIALARKVAAFVVRLLPPFVTLENVYLYRQSRSWQIIARALLTHGYQFNYWRCNTANWGIPQTRQRMIVIARRDGIRPQLPPQTHAENPQAALFGGLQRWTTWYEAIADLIPDLPDSEFAPWQIERLPAQLQTYLCSGTDTKTPITPPAEPAPTITVSDMGGMRAFVVNGQQAQTLVMKGGDSGNAIPYRMDTPFFTVMAGMGDRIPVRAFVEMQHTAREVTVRSGNEPAPTLSAAGASRPSHQRVIDSGRVVQLSLRCLARLQTFPDWYQLPEHRETAARGIGNAVPPLFYQRLAEGIVFCRQCRHDPIRSRPCPTN